CHCNHLTLFGNNVIVPPNTIDFDTVFDDFGQKLVDNLHVVLMISLLLVAYFALIIIMRRLDRNDKQKWGATPLTDNMPDDTYHYFITVHTGMRKMAGTQSRVFFVLIGETEMTEVRKLEGDEKRELSRGSVNTYILSVKTPLGPLSHLRIWHDNSGAGDTASWYLDRVTIKDAQTKDIFIFLSSQWLAIDQADGELQRTLVSASSADLANFQYLFYSKTRNGMSDGHLWFSLLSRPTRSRFTRVQRLSCCLALLFTTMIANAMWYRTEESVASPPLPSLDSSPFCTAFNGEKKNPPSG
ncbi:hypothetical protein CAPTEDRAFT_89312, partial [Capitella teleta]